ncbi:uncharacterized protein G2W53_031918 [Senna tora]|uniref:Uncharacterized protein n=1 Tax=Senna tora TaxID=362788 RepID=A0A834SWS5_9FABA|nr:uncharacterized protein G2W53_031918 [Senna tora]
MVEKYKRRKDGLSKDLAKHEDKFREDVDKQA